VPPVPHSPDAPRPAAGDLLGDRFRIEREVGRGGMGSVFRATDLAGAQPVALKVLTDRSGESVRRFAREAETLRRLIHPGIVRYLAHGDAPAGSWIAMEWLEGRTLAQRLSGGPLTADDTFALARRVAGALAAAHAAGVVHRDIKPENLILPTGRYDDAVLVDFGIARGAVEWTTLTRPGVVIGTPPYMAPEQVRGAPDLGPRADVFSLGCVLWECIAGRTLFEADRPIAVLLRVLVEAAPRLREVAQGVPAAFDELIAAMLAKDPSQRPADGADLAARLEALATPAPLERERRISPSNELGVLTTDELRLFSILVARMPVEAAGASGATVRVPTPVELGDLLRDLTVRGAALGAAVHRLADGSIVAFVTESVPPPELASRAARLSGIVRAALPGWSVVVTTGRGDPAGDVPVGDVVDRAVSLWSGGDEVAIDELTAQLLEGAFTVVRTPKGQRLGAPIPPTDDPRSARGPRTPFVGRTEELVTLRRCFRRVVAERRAQIVTLVGPPGAGKTRLRHELVRTMAEDAVVLVGRGDPMRKEAPLAMLADLVRGGVGLPDGSSPPSLRLVLREGLGRIFDPGDRERAAELFAELVGAPVPDEEASAALRAARRDPSLLAERIREAFVEWLGRCCEVAPVVAILEDAQWADASTMRFVAAAARAHAARPLLVLVLCRPGWQDPALLELPAERIELAALDAAATHELARALLGASADETAVARLARESEGHPLLLEELARALGDDPPRAARATALGLVEHRLAVRSPEERRVLRAAAVLGTVFWRGAVANLLGETPERASMLDAILANLAVAGIVERRLGGRLPEEREYRFRHDLFREAAYETLTPEDRRLGHRRAGKWLEAHREPDAAVLAEHYTRGGHAPRAARAHLEAARRALRVGDVEAAVMHAGRGRELAEDPERLAELASVLAEALMWQGKLDQARRVGWEALGTLRAGSAAWCATAANLASSISRARAIEEGRQLAELLLRLGPIDSVDAALSSAQIAERLVRMGLDDEAKRVLSRASTERIRALAEIDPVVEPMWRFAVSSRQAHRGQTDQAIAGFRWAADRFGELGETRHQLFALVQLLSFQMVAGLYEDVRTSLESAVRIARARGARPLVLYCTLASGHLLLAEGKPRDAARVAQSIEADLAEIEDPSLLADGLCLEAAAALRLGDVDGAIVLVERAVALTAGLPEPNLDVLGVLARALLTRDPGRAIEVAEAGVSFADERDQFLGDDMEVRLALVEALQSAGRTEEARVALASARARLTAHAAELQDPRLRRSLCERVLVNARVLALARFGLDA